MNKDCSFRIIVYNYIKNAINISINPHKSIIRGFSNNYNKKIKNNHKKEKKGWLIVQNVKANMKMG